MIDAATAIIYIIKDLSAVLSLLMIVRFVFLEKLRLNRASIVSFVILIILNSLLGIFLLKNRTSDFDSVMDFVSNLIYIFALLFLTEKAKPGRLILTVFVTVYTVDMFYALISSFTGANLIIEYAVNTVLFAAICFLIYVICVRSEMNFLPGAFSEIPVWVYFALLLFELTCYYKEYGASAQWYKAMYIISVTGIVFCLFYLFFRLSSMAHRQSAVFDRLERQKENLEAQLSGDEELRRFKHDYKNHMAVISALLSAGRIQDAEEYTKKLGSSVSDNLNLIRTGNHAADAIINHKYFEAKSKNIVLTFTGYIPAKCIDDIDICAVISNLLDNAIEASDKCKSDRIIRVEANLVRDHFWLTVTNPFLNISVDKSGNLKTTKADKKNHGLGMKNVERIVEKYNGAVFTEYEYSVFTSNVRMRVKKVEPIG